MGNLLRRLLRWLSGRPDKVMYIGGSDTLPPPLERAEETALIARMDAGDESVRRCPGRRRRSGSAGWSRGSCWPGRR